MVERSKVSRYRRALDALAKAGEGTSRQRRELEGEAAQLGREIHDRDRPGKPRALTADTAVPYEPRQAVKR